MYYLIIDNKTNRRYYPNLIGEVTATPPTGATTKPCDRTGNTRRRWIATAAGIITAMIILLIELNPIL